MRKLATIQKIKNLQPIEGADKIEKATVLGWELVVKKGDFSVGDYCVYCEIDSVLPEKPIFEFLRPRKFRIKTVKLRGQISQGIAFPLSVLAEFATVEIKEGLDITDLLGVEKYEPPPSFSVSGDKKGPFPGFIPKTDELRIQSAPEVLTRPENQGKRCYISEKVDGTSGTFYLKDNEFGVCSRNLELKDSEDNVHWIVAKQYKIDEILRELGRDLVLQGEVLGPKIQSNKYKLPGLKLMLFSIFDLTNRVYLNYHEFVEFVKKINMETVPILRDDYLLGQDDVNGLVKMSEAKSIVNPEIDREGIVIRTVDESQDIDLGRLSFKVVNPKFLLKYEE